MKTDEFAAGQMQRTHALAADWIFGHAQRFAEPLSLWAVERLAERLRADIADRLVKETRAHGSVAFNHSRYPRRVAARGYGFR